MSTPNLSWARPHWDGDRSSSSEIFQGISREWARLCALPSGPAAIAKWKRDHHALATATTLTDLIDLIDGSEAQIKDEVLHALISVFQAGQALAGQVVLQAMLPKLSNMSRETSRSASDVSTQREWHQTVVAVFWETLAEYPTHRRPTKVAANLALDTLHVLTQHCRAEAVEIPQPRTLDTDDAGHGRYRRNRARTASYAEPLWWSAEARPDLEVYEVLAWGVDAEAITRDEAALLVRVYAPSAGNLQEARTEVAAELGFSEATIRARCSRATRKLAAAVRADLLDDGFLEETHTR